MRNNFLNAYLEAHKITLSPGTKSVLEAFSARAFYPTTVPSSMMTPNAQLTAVEKISQLISRMNDAGADESELVRALRHLLVLVDSQKYSLNWMMSEEDNGIEELMKKYPR